MIKRIFNPLVKKLVKTKTGWALGKSILRVGEWFRFQRSSFEHENADKNLREVFQDLTVQNGYFKGLKYPGFSSFGSSLIPKLSGSYESELFPFFERIKTTPYQTIIDVGCAEGFYAAGLAIKYPAAKVEAFDINEKARILCKELAACNNVADRVTVSGECTPSYFQNLDPDLRRLIICDCEGFERHLFDRSNVPAFKKTDLIIELHPMFERDVREYLSDLFNATHDTNIVSSYDDNRKLFELPEAYKDLLGPERLKLVQEGRSFSMDWLILVSKS